MKIHIFSERWSVPDYRNGQTEKDSQLMRLEIDSDTIHTTRFSVNMDSQQVITRLRLIRGVVDFAIKQEEERLKNADEKSL